MGHCMALEVADGPLLHSTNSYQHLQSGFCLLLLLRSWMTSQLFESLNINANCRVCPTACSIVCIIHSRHIVQAACRSLAAGARVWGGLSKACLGLEVDPVATPVSLGKDKLAKLRTCACACCSKAGVLEGTGETTRRFCVGW